MQSQSLQDFLARLEDVQQLIDAHDALTRLRRAEASLEGGGQELGSIAAVVQHLVTDPGPGRRKEVHALNNAGIALLSGHLQGFVVEIYKESAAALFSGYVQNVDALTTAAYTRGNPTPQNIKNMFSTLGFDDVFSGLSWQGMSTRALKNKLQDFVTLRNRIAHGANERVRKNVLVNHLNMFNNFASRLDTKLRNEIRAMTGTNPW